MKKHVSLATAAAVAAGMALAMLGIADPTPTTTSTTTTPSTPETMKAGVAATISDAAFLAGRWQGTMGKNKDNHVEEVWTNAAGNNIVGMFRWLKADGTPSLFELLTISEEDGTLLLRLRHQSAAGIAWEDKDKPLVFRLSEKSSTALHFAAFKDCGDLDSCRYETREGKLHIDVVFAAPSPEEEAKGKKQRPTLKFEMAKTPL